MVSELRAVVRGLLPDAIEEVDRSAKLLGYTFLPATYKGLIVAIAPQRYHTNLMFAKGAELTEHDSAGLLEGTGKKARHIKFRDRNDVSRPQVGVLVRAAAARTPRA